MLRFCESFDTFTSDADLLLRWTAAHSSASIVATTGRNGTSFFRGNNPAQGYIAKTLDAQATWIVGFGYRTSYGGNIYEPPLLIVFDGGTTHVTLTMSTTKRLRVFRGTSFGGTLLATGQTALQMDVWNFIEFKVKISDTVGEIHAQINGIPETFTFETGTSTTQDTRNGGNATADNFQFFGNINDVIVQDLDDVYFCDTTGSTNNNFLGDIRVEAIFPNGNGNSSQFVGSDGNSTDNYLLVDETDPNDADYVESSTVGNKDTYTYTNVTPTAGNVLGVQIATRATKTDAGTRSLASVARLSGTEVDSADKVLTTSYAYHLDVRETKPGGGAWSISDVNSAEFGVKVTA